MERLTTKKCGEFLIKYNGGEYRSPCFGCESMNKCNPEKVTCGFYKALKKLAEYEDLEEQGKLLKLPCAVGDTVYVKMQFGGCAKAEVRDFTYFLTCGFCIVVTSDKFGKQNIPFTEFGKTVFFAREEAEEALKRMEGKG